MKFLDRNLYLTGMMGSGKTTVGRMLAGWLDLEFIDLDEAIEARTGRTIGDIFSRDGEDAFRRLEKEILAGLAAQGPRVIAAGGGTIIDPENRRLMEETGHTVYLHADMNLLAKRVGRGRSRPLLGDSPRASLRKIWNQRRQFYESIGRRVISSSEDPSVAAQLVLMSLPGMHETIWEGKENVSIGANLIPLLFDHIAAENVSGPIAIVSHRRLFDRYEPFIRPHLKKGRTLEPILLPEGERTKDFKGAQAIFRGLVRIRADRKTPLIILGGGVLGDVAGYAASTFMRGIPFYQLPTTLLAQADSSLGGKNAVNMNGAKNLIGTFYFAERTCLDLLFLLTLPKREISAGMAEIVKAGIIADPELLDYIERNAAGILDKKLPVLYEALRRAVLVKMKVVESDPRESGDRRKLNVGHTFAHAVESAAGFRGMNHGEAVSCGMIWESRLSEALNLAPKGFNQRLERILSALELPTRAERFSAKTIIKNMAMDKKRQGAKILFVLPRAAGELEEVALEPAEIERAAGNIL